MSNRRPRIDQERAERAASLIDAGKGLVGREIFSDEEIYNIELERIFGRAWLYLAHESQIPKPNDFVQVNMGIDPVLVCRNRKGGISAFLNSCRHRGAPVCRADVGNARAFVCPYHGWTYDTSGSLIHVPGDESLYEKSVDKSCWSLPKVAQVASYGGLIFGTFDPDAPPLDEFLGDARWGLDLLLVQGDLVAVPGVTRWVIDANWKFAADNAIGDMYHGAFAHRSAILASHGGSSGAGKLGAATAQDTSQQPGLTVITEYGHGFTANYAKEDNANLDSPLSAWRRDPEVKRKLGPVGSKIYRANMNIFPNLFVHTGSRELMIRNPLGPHRLEVWKTTLVDRNADPAVRREQVRSSNRHFGPGGMFEQDDGENWAMSTSGAVAPLARRFDLNYTMGLGRGQVQTRTDEAPTHVPTLVNEHAQLWMYRCWADYVKAGSWSELKQSHSIPEGVL